MTSCAVDTLLREQQTTVLRERRTADRQPFVRPLQIIASRTGETLRGFSRDVSRHGISVIIEESLSPGTIATLRIHSVYGSSVTIRAEVRWCDTYGEGWYVSGWHFLDSK